ncbi:MAG: hypothetical protein ACF8OB_08870 [Phycisphaeraceae bacterium JB051]
MSIKRYRKTIYITAWSCVLLLVVSTVCMIVHQSPWLAEHHPQWVSTTRLLMHLSSSDHYRDLPAYKEISKRYSAKSMSDKELNMTMKVLFKLTCFTTQTRQSKRTYIRLIGPSEDPFGYQDYQRFVRDEFEKYSDQLLVRAYVNKEISPNTIRWMAYEIINQLKVHPQFLRKTIVSLWIRQFIDAEQLSYTMFQELVPVIHQVISNPASKSVDRYVGLTYFAMDRHYIDEKQFKEIDQIVFKNCVEYKNNGNYGRNIESYLRKYHPKTLNLLTH